MTSNNLILTPIGYRPAWQLQPGDVVIGRDGVENTINSIEAVNATDAGWVPAGQEFDWFLVNGHFRIFRAQSIFMGDNVTHGYLLQPGDTIFDKDGAPEVITTVEQINTSYTWYRLDLTGDRSFVMDGVLHHNASRFLVTGGSGTWGNTNNWSATDGGGSGASAPINGDAVQFTTSSGAANMDTTGANRACTSLVQSGTWSGTFTVSTQLTMAGALTITRNVAGSSTIVITASATITNNGKTIPNLTLQGASQTYTWADAPTITGTLTYNGTGTLVNSGAFTCTVGNFTTLQSFTLSGNISCSGTATNTNNNTFNGSFTITTVNLTMNGQMLSGTGSPAISLSGGGTWSGNSNLQVATTNNGALTLGSAVNLGGTFTHASSTVTAAGGGTTMTIGSAAATITCNSTGFCSGTLIIEIQQALTFNGTQGASWTRMTYSNGTNRTVTLTQGNTYTCTGTANVIGSASSGQLTIASSSATLQVVLNFSGASAVFMGKTTATRIDSSGGGKAFIGAGTLTTTTNWAQLADTDLALNNPATSAKPFTTFPAQSVFSSVIKSSTN